MTAPLRSHGLTLSQIKCSCTSKKRYSDSLTAMGMGVGLAERNGQPLFIYQCQICKGWHLTRKSRGLNGNPAYPCKFPDL